MEYRRGLYLDQCYLYYYVNDICNVSCLMKIILFADDTNTLFYWSKLKPNATVLGLALVKLSMLV